MGLFDLGDLDWAQIMGAGGVGGVPPSQQGPSFNDRFGGGGPPPMPQSPISPENIAKNMAARGIGPPPVDVPPQATNVGAALTGEEPFRPSATAEGMRNWRNDYDTMNNGGVPGVTSAPSVASSAPGVGGVGAPLNIQSSAQQAATQDATAQPGAKKDDNSLLAALRGVKAPAAPELQRLGTPAAPRPTATVKSGTLMALLNAMGATQGSGGRELPSTLARAIGRG